MERESIKDRLNKALSYYGITQTELAKRSGIPKGSINQYCTGHVEPKEDRIYLICRALNIQEAWLLGFDVPMCPPPASKAEHFDFTVTEEEMEFLIEVRGLLKEDLKVLKEYVKFLYGKAKEVKADEKNDNN